MLEWAGTTHGDTLEALVLQAGMLALPGHHGADMHLRITWAMSDGVPDDGGPPLAARYVMRPDIPERDRTIAAQIARARPDLYLVHRVLPGAWVEVQALEGDTTRHRVVSGGVSAGLQPDSLVLARLLDVDGVTTFWGPVCRYPLVHERKWRAFLRSHDLTTAAGSLAAQQFVPEDRAEPLPDGLHLLCSEWGVEDDLDVCEQLADWPHVVELGPEIGASEVWANAWLAPAEPGTVALGGCRKDPDQVEVARLLISPTSLQALSASPAVLAEVGRWVESKLEGVTPSLFQAA